MIHGSIWAKEYRPSSFIFLLQFSKAYPPEMLSGPGFSKETKLCLACSILLKDKPCRASVGMFRASGLRNRRAVWSWQADGFEVGLDIPMFPHTSLRFLPLALLPNSSALEEHSVPASAWAVISTDRLWCALKLSFS